MIADYAALIIIIFFFFYFVNREIFSPPLIIRAGGGIHNFVYQLMQPLNETGHLKLDGSNVLGKLQITWRTNLGEPGRLQTQQILGTVSIRFALRTVRPRIHYP